MSLLAFALGFASQNSPESMVLTNASSGAGTKPEKSSRSKLYLSTSTNNKYNLKVVYNRGYFVSNHQGENSCPFRLMCVSCTLLVLLNLGEKLYDLLKRFRIEPHTVYQIAHAHTWKQKRRSSDIQQRCSFFLLISFS